MSPASKLNVISDLIAWGLISVEDGVLMLEESLNTLTVTSSSAGALAEEEEMARIYGLTSYYGIPGAKSCKHEVIDNGTRLSECRHCKVMMRLKGFDWSAE